MWHHLLHELTGFFIRLAVINQDFTDVRLQVISQGSDEQVTFLVNKERAFFLVSCGLNGFPDLFQVIKVPL